jgi:broad specificity phosphatase PhoE
VTGSALPALAVRRLVLWRHGRTEWNAAGRFQGQLDPPLDDEGRNQAARAAPHLVAAGLSPDDTVVVSSDLSRAAETAATLTALLGVPLILDERLREHGMGSWEGLTRDEVAARFPEQFADWISGRPVRGRGGEDPAEVAERALAALVDLPEAHTAVVVTHGELVVQGSGWRLMRHNSAALQLPDSWADGLPAPAPALRAVPDVGASPEEEEAPATDADAVL